MNTAFGTGRRLVTILAIVAAVATMSSLTATSQAAGTSTTTYVNPLVGHRWGIYRGGSDGLFPAFQKTSGRIRRLLGRMALRPHARWYTSFIPASEIRAKVAGDIAQEQNGHPNVLVWMAMFRLWPQQESAKMVPLSQNQQSAYKRWVDNAARGIGSANVAMVLEPDLPVSLTGWRPGVRLRLVRYAARTFSSLPHTIVYLDAGSSDWLSVQDDISMLERAGIGYVHGFALGSTHHPSTRAEIRYGRQISIGLAKAGYSATHFVIDTADNGHGYTSRQFWHKYPHGNVNDPPACTSLTQRVCVSLGIPPTTNVTNPNWQLPARLMEPLLKRCDGFVWVGRPWLANNGGYFSRQKAVDVARTSPYFR